MNIRRVRNLLLAGALYWGLSSLGGPAYANIIGNDTANFNPNPSGLDFVTVHGSDTLADGILNTGLFFNRAKNTLPSALDMNGHRIDPEDTVTFMDFGVAYGLTNHFELGFSLSTLLDQQVDRSSPGAQFAATGLNDIRFLSKYQFVNRDPVGAALIISVDLNQARNNPFSGRDAGPTVNFEGATDFTWKNVHFAGNLGYRLRSRGSAIPGALYSPLPNQIVASGAVSQYFPSIDLKLIAEGFLAKSTEAVSQIDEKTISTEFLLGAKYDLTSRVATHLGFGSRLAEGLFTPEWRIYAGLNITLDILQRPIDSMVSAPLAPTIVSQTHYKGYLPQDIEVLKDVDFDEMAQKHEFVLRTNIPNADMKGKKPPFEILRLAGFDFDFASDVIRPEYFPMLDQLAAYLKTKPDVIKVRVEGHTDSVGADERKRLLGMRRAQNVVNYLKAKGGFAAIELEPVGYGADRPIADNSNFQGRKKNRRVEVRILRRIEELPVRVK